jgi:hypothetical protein
LLPRDGFALSGPSVALDPRTHAVRPDLADVRLAAYVFSPHYAAPLERTLATAASLRSARDPASEVLATLNAGEVFEVLEFAGSFAWGVAPAAGLVGYLPADALARG